MAIEDLVTKADLERFIADQVNSPGSVDVSAINNLQASLDALQTASTPLEWVTPVLLAGWEQYGNPEYSQVAYRVTGKKVDLRGRVTTLEEGAALPIFVLPAELAPERHQVFPCVSTAGLVWADVKSDGTVVFGPAIGAGGLTWVSLDAISFWAAD